MASIENQYMYIKLYKLFYFFELNFLHQHACLPRYANFRGIRQWRKLMNFVITPGPLRSSIFFKFYHLVIFRKSLYIRRKEKSPAKIPKKN